MAVLVDKNTRLIVHTTESVESATFAIQDDGFGDARMLPLNPVVDAAAGLADRPHEIEL